MLCRNLFNVTGECAKSCCPLSNSGYATVIEQEGDCYLFLKTPERCHTPNKWWERIKLSENAAEAERQIELHMKNVYKEHMLTKCKARLVKIREYLARMRLLAERPEETVAFEPAKLRRREEVRETAALKAAKITDAVEEELLSRLKGGFYNEIYNLPLADFQHVTGRGQEDNSETEDNSDLEDEDAVSEATEEGSDLEDETEALGDLEDLQVA